MTNYNQNWQVFPYSDDSVVNLRFIRSDLGLPTVNEVFRRSTYKTDSSFESAMANKAVSANDAGYNVYQCLNPINYDFAGKSAADSDIFCIDSLFLDIDRVGTKTSPATDEELQRAWKLTRDIVEFLSTQGWPAPTIVMSGNGYHLYFGLDEAALEPTEDNKNLRRRVLKCLKKAFDTDFYELDPAVCNESRLTKVIGTLAYKGKASDERPYRRVELVSERSNCFFVTNSMLNDLVETLGDSAKDALQSISARYQRISTVPETPRRVAEVVDALRYVDADCHYDTWCRIVWAVMSTGWTCAEGLARDWSATAPDRYDEQAFMLMVHSFNPAHDNQITLGTLFHHAKSGGWNG